MGHEPGLSTAELRVRPGLIETELILSRVEFETLLSLDMDGDGEASPSEHSLAKTQLTALARDAWSLRSDEAALVSGEPVWTFDSSNNVRLAQSYPVGRKSRIVTTSTLLTSLPRGHRQWVTVRAPDGRVSAERLLSADANTIELEVGEAGLDAPPRKAVTPFAGFVVLGIEHIVTGFDHLLFLLALLVVAPGFRRALPHPCARDVQSHPALVSLGRTVDRRHACLCGCRESDSP
jgi:hypothetical protein